MACINYNKTEQALLSYLSNAEEIALQDIEILAQRLEDGDTVWVAVELGRHPSTDMRTYTLHVYEDKPKFDYYGAEKLNLKMLGV